MISYSQNREDVMLYRAFKNVGQGFYVDIGAQDPTMDSVTKLFYDMGWSGINIEPNPEYYERLTEERPRDKNINIVVSDKKEVLPFYLIKHTGLSTSKKYLAERAIKHGFEYEERKLPCDTLDNILKRNHVVDIHFLKIDAEGSEEEVLAGLDLNIYRPWVLIVEAIEPLTLIKTEHSWEEKLIEYGYIRAYYDGLNTFYVAKEKEELLQVFAAPPNVLDEYISFSHWKAKEDLKNKTDKIIILENDLSDRSRELVRSRNRIGKLEEDILVSQNRIEELRDRLQAIVGMSKEINRLREELGGANSELARVHAVLSQVLSSTSWKITIPVRVIGSSVRKAVSMTRNMLHEFKAFIKRALRSAIRLIGRNALRISILKRFGIKFLKNRPLLKASIAAIINEENLGAKSGRKYESGDDPKGEMVNRLPEPAYRIYYDLLRVLTANKNRPS